MPRFEGDVFRLGTAMIYPVISNCSVRIGKPGFVGPVAGNDWPARRAEGCSRSRKDRKIFRRKVPQRLMVSGAGSGAAIAFLPAKASPQECLPAKRDNATSYARFRGGECR